MSLFTPRDYQRDALLAAREMYDRGTNRLLGRMFTGGGKTSGVAMHVPQVFPEVVDRHGLLFIAHRREILYQAYEKFRKAYPEKWCGIEMGERHATGYEDFLFVSVDSLGRLMSSRIWKYQARDFGAILVDEGHHATEDGTWDNILTYFGSGSDPNTRFDLPDGQKRLTLLLTATPKRHDGKGLYPFVDDIAFDYDILYGVREGWLADIRCAYPYEEMGLRDRELALEDEMDYLIRVYRDVCQGHRTLAFTRSVEQSVMLAATLDKMGLARTGHVDAKTDAAERAEIVEAFARGDLDFLSNRLVFAEGYDNPGITCILDNAPTKSTPLHLQKLGRGLRPSDDAKVDSHPTAAKRREAIRRSSKPHLLYVATFDPTEHGLDVVASIWGRDDVEVDPNGRLLVEEVIDVIEDKEEEQPERPVREVGNIDDMEITLKEVDVWGQTIYNEDLKALTPLRWVQNKDETGAYAALYLDSNPFATRAFEETPVIVHFREEGGRVVKRVIEVGGWNAALKKPRRAKVDVVGEAFDLASAVRKFDGWLQSKRPQTYRELQRSGDFPADPAKVKYLDRHGISYRPGVTDGTADLLIADYRIKAKAADLNL